VPGLNILKDRIRRTIEEMAKIAEPDEGLISGYIQICRRDLELLQPIIELRDFSLAVINELFILRHLLTLARDDLTIIGGDLKSGVPKSGWPGLWLQVSRPAWTDTFPLVP